MRMARWVPLVLGLCAAALVFGLGARHARPAPAAYEFSVPRELAGYSHLTGSVSASPPGTAVALFQHGWGVEFLDSPQAVVLGAGGDTYRRVDVAEDRAGSETQGDPAPMLLSPDGTRVAVGDHGTTRPDVVIVDLATGDTTSHPLPAGRSVVPVAWSSDGETVASLLSDAPTNPYSGSRITGDVGLLDLSDDSTVLMEEGTATAVAFSPDGSQLAVELAGDRSTQLSVVDLASGSRRALASSGVLAGPTAWSPDGRLIATTTVKPSGAPAGVVDAGIPTGLAFVDPAGGGDTTPAPLTLSLPGAGRVLGWTGPDEVLTLLDVPGADPCCGAEGYTLSTVPLDGSQPTTLMRIDDIQSYGVGRFQLAAAAAGRLQVVDPDGVDRGTWPLAVRGFLTFLAGLLTWWVARFVLRRLVPRAPAGRPEVDPASTAVRTSSGSMS